MHASARAHPPSLLTDRQMDTHTHRGKNTLTHRSHACTHACTYTCTHSLCHLNASSISLVFIFLKHQLHPSKSVHGLNKTDVLLVLHVGLELDVLAVVEGLDGAGLGQQAHDLLPVGVQHGDVHIAHLPKGAKHLP